jgi:hypothetical protein
MLVSAENACVVVFNMQLELIPLLENGTQLLNDCCWMLDVAETLALPKIVIEHKKLGAPSQALKEVAGRAPYLEKTHFDCTRHDTIVQAFEATGRKQFVLAGAESHVCILQSAAGLRELGKEVFVVSDAISSRNRVDHERALSRLSEIGAHLLTKEMFFFECIRQSEYPEYVATAMRFLDGRYIR